MWFPWGGAEDEHRPWKRRGDLVEGWARMAGCGCPSCGTPVHVLNAGTRWVHSPPPALRVAANSTLVSDQSGSILAHTFGETGLLFAAEVDEF